MGMNKLDKRDIYPVGQDDKPGRIEQESGRYGAGQSDSAYEDAWGRLQQKKRQERYRRRMLMVIGVGVLALWVVLGELLGWWGLGLVFGPIGGFFFGWSVIQELLAYASQNG